MNWASRTFALALIVAVTGCGPDWKGEYLGDLSWQDVRCSPNTTFTGQGGMTSWKMTESGDHVLITIDEFDCGPFDAKTSWNTATLSRTVCRPFTWGEYTFTEEFPSGTLRMNEGSDLIVDLEYRVDGQPMSPGAAAVWCTAHARGMLFHPQFT